MESDDASGKFLDCNMRSDTGPSTEARGGRVSFRGFSTSRLAFSNSRGVHGEDLGSGAEVVVVVAGPEVVVVDDEHD